MPSETPISSSFELLSHPDRTLARHLRGCNEVSALALQFKHVADAFFPKALLEEMRHLLVFFHDFGKATDFFQYKIIDAVRQEGTADFQNAHQAYIADFATTKAAAISQLLYQNPHLGDHAKLGAYFVLTVFQHDDPLVAVILLKVIRRHHGHLTNFSESIDLSSKKKRPQLLLNEERDVRELQKQLEYFNTNQYRLILAEEELDFALDQWGNIKSKFMDPLEIADLKDLLEDANDLRYFFLQHFLFSLLLAADKGDMMLELETDKHERIKENRLLPPSLVELYKAKLFTGKQPGAIDHLREEAYQRILANVKQHGHQSFFSLTLPTGLGKTFAAYRVAIDLQHQVRSATDKTPRIIYCLPFTSIIDQNAQILTDMIDHYVSEGGKDIDQSWLATHHYLSAYNDKYDGEELLKDEAEYLTAGWEQEVIVTTFVQLLESIFTNRNKALRKFHNLTNAVLILDEVQSIPAKYFEAVEVVFRKLADYFGTKFVFVTATQPFLFKNPDDITELTDPRPLVERTQTRYYFDQLTRIQLDQTALKASQYEPLAIEEWITVFLEDINDQPDKSFLIINNTIAQARQVFRTLQKSDIPDTEFIYLSSSLLPIKRREKIDQIKANLAARSRKDTIVKRLVVVSTQVVEAGVDIDLDVVYRDFAPIDSLNQSAGRCNRNGNNGLGVVKLFHAGKARHVYDPVLRDITARVLGTYPPVIEEKSLYQLNLDYAAAVQKAIAAGSDASKTLIDAMKGLNLEDVANNLKLIEDNRDAYNVFIECCPEARQVWQEYINLVKKLEGFELKKEVKKLMPRLLQYVTRFPKNNKKNPYFPPPDKADRFIINDPNWEIYYDLDTGYKLTEDDHTAVL